MAKSEKESNRIVAVIENIILSPLDARVMDKDIWREELEAD